MEIFRVGEASMKSGNRKYILLGALVAGALTCALPAVAADGGALFAQNGNSTGLTGRTLSDEEMSDMRGRFTPGSRVSIRFGDTVYSDSNPVTPGSSTVTVNLGPGSVSRGFASTSGTGGSSSVSITLSGVTVRTSAH
jgi:hypothetical protein